ncbi:alpha/beta fold hydrolase [Amycolatopsis sp. 195334CR]|uniref:alpha/beta fold hydrolase n=1 Tax=Amycolatopsis sp. 195334CR TaxID=2814588 RepID=UPI001A902E09|nr:alpha/beta hydrolase [Amycolatopsis sp. 195334CR]MBN6040121.1 alpha/beta hydrolase [Amycolatopsis sp. 195334CR]
MGEHIELNGTRTWYEVRGEGEPVVLLHGGFSDAREFTGNLDALNEHFRVYRFDRRGHGRTADAPGPITHQRMTEDTIAFLEQVVRGPARLVGYSDGGFVALLAALRRPDLVRELVLISSAFATDGFLVQPDPDGEMPREVIDYYGEVSPDGPEHFPVVFRKLTDPANPDPSCTTDELAGIDCRALVVAADDDLVHAEHTLALYRGLREAQLAVVPGASHAILVDQPELTTAIVTRFLTVPPRPTLIPVRRAQALAP